MSTSQRSRLEQAWLSRRSDAGMQREEERGRRTHRRSRGIDPPWRSRVIQVI